MTLPPLLRALRPLQWAKNLVIAGPLIFVPAAWGELAAWSRTAEAMLAFSCLASSTYLINDLMDRAADQHHPRKRLRPIASGAVTETTARGLSAALAVLGVCWLGWIDQRAPLASSELPTHSWLLIAGLVYLGLTTCYSLWLKRIPILDVILVALGFVLRAAAGGGVLRVHLSPWLLLCTFLLMLMIALGKRHWELAHLDTAHAHRPNLAEYDLPLVDQFLSITAAMTLMAYALYTIYGETSREGWLMLTIPFVLYGVLRYLTLIHVEHRGGTPEEAILHDPATLINIGLWLVVSVLILRWTT